MRNLLTVRRAVIAAIGDLDPADAAALLRGVVSELEPPNVTTCSGILASWCQIHGTCRCPLPAEALDDPGCPLHAPESDHDRSSDSEARR